MSLELLVLCGFMSLLALLLMSSVSTVLRWHGPDYPSPSNLSYAWNVGFLLIVNLVVQVLTGILLACRYVPHTDLAFSSVEFILRDVSFGWLIRYVHANAASLMFVLLYLHTFRGIVFGSYQSPRSSA